MRISEKQRMIFTCLSGNTLEWFDFAVYGFVAHIIAKQFFPAENYLLSILLTYSVFAVGFLARPLGSLIFGHIGDTLGRKQALVVSNFVMAVPTVCIGLLPTYETIGMAAPLLLLVCRILQGASVGGEFTGSFVYLIEQAPQNKKASMGCWADLGVHLGMMSGSLCVAILSQSMPPESFQSYGWRIPFMLGLLLAVVGVYMRRKLPESKEFSKPIKSPIRLVFKEYKHHVILGTFLLTLNAVGYYIISVFIPNQTIFLGKFPPHKALYLSTFIMSTLVFGNILVAYIADKGNRTRITKGFALTLIPVSLLLFYSLENASLTTQITFMVLFAFSIGGVLGACRAILVHIFPTFVRFTGVALALNLANGVLGGATPLAATWISNHFGHFWPALLVVVACIATYISLLGIERQSLDQSVDTLKKAA